MGKKTVGIHIGTQHIKFLLVEKTKKENIIKSYTTADIPAQIKNRDEYIINKIKEVLKENRWHRYKTTVLNNFEGAVARGLKIPLIPEEELPEVVKREVKKIYSDISDKELVYQVMGEEEFDGKPHLSIFFILIPKDKLEPFQKSTFKIDSLDFDIFALDRLFNREVNAEKNTLVLDFGSENVILMIFKGKILQVYREVTIGGNEITKTISDVLQIPIEEAEDIKIKYGYVSKEEAEKMKELGNNKGGQINFAYQIIQGKLLRKISHSIDYFKTQNRGMEVEECFICGGGANLKQLDKYILEEISDINIFYYTGINNFSIDKKVSSEFTDHAMSFVSTMGTALLKKPILKIEKKKEKKPRNKNFEKFKYVGYASIAAIPIIIYTGYLFYSNSRVQSEVETYRQKITALAEEVKIYDKYYARKLEYQKDIDFIKSLRGSEEKFVDFFYELSNITNENIYFTNISSRNNGVSVVGYGISRDGFPEIHINNFYKRLKDSYPSADLKGTNKTKILNLDGASFSITLELMDKK